MTVLSEAKPYPFVLLKIYVYFFKDERSIQAKVLYFMSFKIFIQRKSTIFILSHYQYFIFCNIMMI